MVYLSTISSNIMAIEKWAAIASIGLFAMFSGEMISIYYFMTNVPGDFEFGMAFEANPKILQFISIGVAPAIIMAAVSFIMSKRYGSKLIGTMIIAGGIILLGGMGYAHSLIEGINSEYTSDLIPILTPLFMLVSIPIIFVGTQLLKVKKRKTKKDYF